MYNMNLRIVFTLGLLLSVSLLFGQSNEFLVLETKATSSPNTGIDSKGSIAPINTGSLVSFDLDTIIVQEYPLVQSASDCEHDYFDVVIPITISESIDSSFELTATIHSSTCKPLKDYIWIKDQVIVDPAVLNDTFLIRIYDDAISESTEKLDIKVNSNDLEVGADTLMTIILEDNDFAPWQYDKSWFYETGDRLFSTDNTPFKSSFKNVRSQYIFSVNELSEMGLKPGNIAGLSFFVDQKNSTGSISSFSIKLGHTALNQFETENPAFITGDYTLVFEDTLTTDLDWNDLDFTEEWNWNGEEGIVVEISFNRDENSMDDIAAADMQDTHMTQFAFSDVVDGCCISDSVSVQLERPTLRWKQSRELQLANMSSSKSTVTEFGYEMHFYDDSKLICTVEHNTKDTTDCAIATVSHTAESQIPLEWLQGTNISGRSFYLESQNNFEGSVILYFTNEELSAWNIEELKIMHSDQVISAEVVSDFTLIESEELLIFDVNEDIKAVAFYVNHLGGFALTDATSISLPVEILRFDGENRDELNQLFWEVALEYGVFGYEVQRSFDGREFESVSWIESTNTNDFQRYEYEDSNLLHSNKYYYYRLKIIDQDGKSNFSSVIPLFVKGDYSGLYVFPNPVLDELNISLSNSEKNLSQITFYSVDGVVRMNYRLDDSIHETKLSLKDLEPGMYLMKVQNTQGEEYVKPIIKR